MIFQVKTASSGILRHKKLIQSVFYQNKRDIHLVKESVTIGQKGIGPLEETPNRCWTLCFNPLVVFNIKTGYPRIGDVSSIHIVIRRDVCGRKSSKIRAGKNWE